MLSNPCKIFLKIVRCLSHLMVQMSKNVCTIPGTIKNQKPPYPHPIPPPPMFSFASCCIFCTYILYTYILLMCSGLWGDLGLSHQMGYVWWGAKTTKTKNVCARYSWHCDKRDAPISSPQCKFYMFCVYILYTISLLIFMLDFGVT